MNRYHQPYQRRVGRPQTSALRAMLLGRGRLPNPMDQQRLLAKRRKSQVRSTR